MNPIKKTFQYGEHTVTIETGEIARQSSAVLVTMGDTVLLVTAVAVKNAVEGRDFFPLTVNYQERTYAAGRIPGGFFKREGRPSEAETLTSRLIDRPIRPLFPKGFCNEVQLIASVMSLDKNVSPDIPALLGASAALAISGMPFLGPIGAARVGYVDGSYVLNPSRSQLTGSALDLVVAGTEKAVLMVESEANELSESVMLGAVVYGHDNMQVAIQAINELKDEVGTTAWDWQAPEQNEQLQQSVAQLAEQPVAEAYQIQDKMSRQDSLAAIRDSVVSQLCNPEDDSAPDAEEVKGIIAKIEKRTVRDTILAGKPRIDGRDTQTVRPITVRTGVLPRTHGSALFTRGETQAIVVTTLGTEKDAQIIDDLHGECKESFMLHYNFPPYSVGEVGFIGSPKRREIGHGKLAKRALEAVVPRLSGDFPYSTRVVSEITESNGSSSMATVCGASLSMMDAGVPVRSPVAGIAMGLIKEGDQFAILSDILGDEDHLGDMDFKVAGTAEGITALQMDIKIEGITKEIMDIALNQAKAGRLHILGIMNDHISQPRQELSAYAPRITTMKINPDKIRDVIGKGGAVIRSIIEESGASIDITDDGVVKIAAVEASAVEAAKERIELLTADVVVGAVYDGTISKIVDFGAFVTVLPGKDGLVHISQICHERVDKVSDKLAEGQVVKVKVLEVDRQGRIRLSMKELLEEVTE